MSLDPVDSDRVCYMLSNATNPLISGYKLVILSDHTVPECLVMIV